VNPKLRFYILLALSIILLDQFSKAAIKASYLPGESRQVIGDFIKFTLVYNSGGAFGISIGSFWIYLFLSLIAIVVVTYLFFKSSDQAVFYKICLALVVGGAIGNMIDRVLYRKVVDFIDVDIFNISIPSFDFLGFFFSGFYLHRWYNFNVADIAITLSLVGFLIHSFIGNQSAKNRSFENDNYIIENE